MSKGLDLSNGRFLQYIGKQNFGDAKGVEIFRGLDGLQVFRSVDDTEHGELVHVSLSYPDHDPDWDTIKYVRQATFSPIVDVMMVLPRKEDYVNLHPHTFYLWQIPEKWGIR